MLVIIKLIDNEILWSLRCIYDLNDLNKKILKLDLKKKILIEGNWWLEVEIFNVISYY